jgi:cellulose synthase/poly-beta-1,6-N-acetylglucosamine synthase-like glycosyltransferase
MWIIYLFLFVYVLAMCFVLFYSFVQAHLLYHFYKGLRKQIPIPALSRENLPLVTIQLPLFNEKYVVERLINSIACLDYPSEKLQVQVLDDSTDETSTIVNDKIKDYPNLDIQHLRRENRRGFKAGALKEGLEHAKGDLIAVFDADFVPEPEFLLKTVPFFQDEGIGMVQTRWTHLNKKFSLLTQLQAFALDAHFMVEQIGRNSQGAFINFNGTGGIWRKSCILDAGNWEDDTLTEDLDLSYRAQRKGWKFIYRPEIESPAELPPVMPAIKSQQFRWTKGGAECAKKHLFEVFSGDYSGRIKVHATGHLLNSVIFIAVFLVSVSSIPIWWALNAGMIPESLYQAAAVFLLGFVIIALVYFSAQVSLNGLTWRNLMVFVYELFLFLAVSMGMALHNSLAVWEGLTGKKSPFVRTPKYNLSQKNKWKESVYHQLNIPATTYFEAVLALTFSSLVVFSIYFGSFEMLLFHTMLAIGYSIVCWSSFKSYALASKQ